MEPRYLTKSRFKLGLECPVKLFYTKKAEYFDGRLEDEFLQSLAEGGFQVGELAKLYYPGGSNIQELDYALSLAQTDALLQQQEVIIYEAAFRYENLFVRADLIIKNGNNIQLIEVKAKSFDPDNDSFCDDEGFIISKWQPYLYDAAFQEYVVKHSWPAFTVSTCLLLVDKRKTTSIDGLNQKFLLYKMDGRKQVQVKGPVDEAALGEKILTLQPIDAFVARIYEGTEVEERNALSFEERIAFLAGHYTQDKRIDHPLGSQCRDCEFRLEKEVPGAGGKSGFHECWRAKAAFTDADFRKPSVLDIWKMQKRQKSRYIGERIYFQEQLKKEVFEPKKPSKKAITGLSQWERQWLQVEKAAAGDQSHYIDIAALRDIQAKWRYPYHFIDFETTAVAIPFTRGRRPYDQVAFQFSHHLLMENGQIEHRGQWINAEPGIFPNFDFVRALKKELSGDDGTIFRYAAHENTILNAIYRQLLTSEEEDKDLLCDWIRQISHRKGEWEGSRDMVDLKDIVQKFYYHPLTNGSISIKQVMPAILSSCAYLQHKYSQPIYGKEIPSMNFTDWQWVRYDADGKVINPYELLPPIFAEASNEVLDATLMDEEAGITEGGAAMSAYAKMQFVEMSAAEREKVVKALLQYCELDTFAMVLLWEGLAHWINVPAQ